MSGADPMHGPVHGQRNTTAQASAPLVSIVIPTYNARKWVCEAVDSALAQEHTPCEIIVVDDGSTDETRELLQNRYGDSIKYLYQANRGLAAARNRGMAAARGKYLQFLDADDVLHPAKISVQVAALEQQSEYAIAYCDFCYFDEEMPIPGRESGWRSRYRSGDIFGDLLRMNFIVCHAALVRAPIIHDIGGFDENLPSCQDYDLWLRLAAHGSHFLFVPGSFVYYRQTAGSMSTDWAREFASTVRVLEKVPTYARLDRIRVRAAHRVHLLIARTLLFLARINGLAGVITSKRRQRKIVRLLQAFRARSRSLAP